MDKDIEKLKELLEKATPGEWTSSDILDNDGGGVIAGNNRIVAGANTTRSDSNFIATSRNLLPKLLRDYERMKSDLEYFVERCESGTIRSQRTYARFKTTLKEIEGEKASG